MSIYKSEQRCNRTLKQILAGLFLRRKCPSFVTYQDERHECQCLSGHKGRHGDGELFWGYGDNWLEMP